ncbi:MAG TPA: DNA polymerase Y family protein [Acidimicrobiales bacterium]|nr:DNA polymerase Y family protein [Acidimicrobiales bacterium]
MTPTRTVVVWWDDWPVVVAGRARDPVVVVANNKVLAVSVAAYADGVRVGMRRREAQGRCPAADVLAVDEGADARAFEAVVAAVEELCPRVEVVRPGVLAFAARGPSRYFGGDAALSVQIRDVVVDAARTRLGVETGRGPAIGVADGNFAASLAARAAYSAAERVLVVPPGKSAEFLAPMPIAAIGDAAIADVARRLGLRTLGVFAGLDAADVLGRFGAAGVAAHRRARGLEVRALTPREPPPELAVEVTFDPPADTVDRVAFAARGLASELADGLAARGLVATALVIEVETEHGERRERRWRSEGALDARAVAERVRWQAEGWLTDVATRAEENEPTAGITLLRLRPDEVDDHEASVQSLWGGATEAGERVARAVARVQGLLGPDAATTAVLVGGRGPAEQVRMIPWGDARAVDAVRAQAPWPGRLPSPSPAVVLAEPVALDVLDMSGAAVRVSGRGELSSPPMTIVGPHGVDRVTGWAGPWPAEERWWDVDGRRRRARLQVRCESGAAHLCLIEGGRWWLEASY